MSNTQPPRAEDPVSAATRRAQLRQRLARSPLGDMPAALEAFRVRPLPGPPLRDQQEPAARVPPRTVSHAIVVLGVPVKEDGFPSEGMLARVARAAELAGADPLAIVVVSGAAVQNNFVEADAMAAELVGRGVSPTRIYVEPHARTTLDNAAFALALIETILACHKPGTQLEKLTVISEPYHAPRSLRIFAAACANAGLSPEVRLGACETVAPQVRAWVHPRRRVRLGERMLGLEHQAALERCIEEKRRVFCGW